MLRCIIIDEHAPAVQVLKYYIKKTPYLECTAVYTDSKAALAFMKTNSVDMIFLDIKASLKSTAASIAVLQQHAQVILTSATKKYALDGFEFGVVDYLVKPFTFLRFSRAVEKAYKIKYPPGQVKPVSQTASLKGGYIFIKESTRLVRVELDDIYYVMGLKNYVSIHTKTQRIVSLQTMKQMEDMLPGHRFIRVHRSYFVAMDKIISVEKQQIHVKDKMIPIGSIYLALFMKKLLNISNQ